jgi:putative ABC transport system substrate-binding protein
MRRRDFIRAITVPVIAGTVDATLRPGHASAETSFKRPLIACVVGGSKAATERFFGGLPQGMRELGYAEGRDYGFEVRYAEGDFGRIPQLTEELIRLKPDVFVSGTMAGVIAAKKLTNTIPIVSLVLTDPVGFGVAASHARPGGNVTGVLLTVEDLPNKLLTLAHELLPGARKIGLLVNSTNPIQLRFRGSLETAAATLGDELIVIEVSSRDDLHPAFQRFARDGAKIVVLPQDAMFLNERKRIALFAVAERLPTIFGFHENVDDGGLMSYGTDLRENWHRVATFIDKILKGTKPGDLPMEFPTKLQLVINLATAQALGLVIPPTILARADEVIE